eukprot:3013325-Rhodomonas_salina.3
MLHLCSPRPHAAHHAPDDAAVFNTSEQAKRLPFRPSLLVAGFLLGQPSAEEPSPLACRKASAEIQSPFRHEYMGRCDPSSITRNDGHTEMLHASECPRNKTHIASESCRRLTRRRRRERRKWEWIMRVEGEVERDRSREKEHTRAPL